MNALPPDDIVTYGGITMNLTRHRVARDGRPIKLRPIGFRVLHVLMCRPGVVFTRDQLIDLAWPHDADIFPKIVNVHIYHVRLALGLPNMIRNVDSFGFSLDVWTGG